VPLRRRSEPKQTNDDKHGVTHFGVVYVNELARESMLSGKPARFPLGSTIVREKLPSLNAPPELLAVMLKRAGGFNLKGGDWEFLILDGKGANVKSRETTGSCLGCHSREKDQDFVFRDYQR
jgi:cytochrome P460